ncbi:MAG: hypothetical protein WDN28_05460 [Chthoniobacter sp.]
MITIGGESRRRPDFVDRHEILLKANFEGGGRLQNPLGEETDGRIRARQGRSGKQECRRGSSRESGQREAQFHKSLGVMAIRPLAARSFKNPQKYFRPKKRPLRPRPQRSLHSLVILRSHKTRAL